MRLIPTAREAIGCLALILLAMPNNASGLSPSPSADPVPTDGLIAQNSSDLCRRVYDREGLIVHLRPTPNSPQIGRVEYNSRVTLISDYKGIRGPEGATWIEITFPIRGFISNGLPNNPANLVLCPNITEGRPTRPEPSNNNITNSSLCRQVSGKKAPKGLAVRSSPSRKSAYRGNVPVNSRVLLANSRLISDANGEKREWIEIVAPIQGFISAGNLIQCQ